MTNCPQLAQVNCLPETPVLPFNYLTFGGLRLVSRLSRKISDCEPPCESSWQWCFDGLQLNSTVAITTNAFSNKEAHRLFVGVNIMVKKIQPTAIVVCGKVPACG